MATTTAVASTRPPASSTETSARQPAHHRKARLDVVCYPQQRQDAKASDTSLVHGSECGGSRATTSATVSSTTRPRGYGHGRRLLCCGDTCSFSSAVTKSATTPLLPPIARPCPRRQCCGRPVDLSAAASLLPSLHPPHSSTCAADSSVAACLCPHPSHPQKTAHCRAVVRAERPPPPSAQGARRTDRRATSRPPRRRCCAATHAPAASARSAVLDECAGGSCSWCTLADTQTPLLQEHGYIAKRRTNG